MIWLAAVAAASALSRAIGKRKSQKKKNKWLQQLADMYAPGSMRSTASQLYPELFGAIAGNKGSTGYQNFLYQLAQNPGYIDPRVRNQPLQQAERDSALAMQNWQSQVGRAAGGGGVAEAMDFMNRSALQRNRSNILQNYALWQAEQARKDNAYISDLYRGGYADAYTSTQARTNILGQREPPQSWMGTLGNAGESFVNAYLAGRGGGGGSGTNAAETQPVQPTNNIFNRPSNTGTDFTNANMGQWYQMNAGNQNPATGMGMFNPNTSAPSYTPSATSANWKNRLFSNYGTV